MHSYLLFLYHAIFLVACANAILAADDVPFQQNYEKLWGQDHAMLLNQNKEPQLSLDQSSSISNKESLQCIIGSGIQSLERYGSGFFSMRIRTPPKDTTSIITTYYLNSTINDIHDEIDFEFILLDHEDVLHTNLFINGIGGREQEFHLWFDPSADFHKYSLLWNQHQLMWLVVDIPIRAYKNKTNIGAAYPTQPTKIIATIWSNPDWPNPVQQPNWGDAPFLANYQGSGIDGCATRSTASDPECYSSKYWWNQDKYWQLDSTQQQKYEEVRNKYLSFDNCQHVPNIPECKY